MPPFDPQVQRLLHLVRNWAGHRRAARAVEELEQVELSGEQIRRFAHQSVCRVKGRRGWCVRAATFAECSYVCSRFVSTCPGTENPVKCDVCYRMRQPCAADRGRPATMSAPAIPARTDRRAGCPGSARGRQPSGPNVARIVVLARAVGGMSTAQGARARGGSGAIGQAEKAVDHGPDERCGPPQTHRPRRDFRASPNLRPCRRACRPLSGFPGAIATW